MPKGRQRFQVPLSQTKTMSPHALTPKKQVPSPTMKKTSPSKHLSIDKMWKITPKTRKKIKQRLTQGLMKAQNDFARLGQSSPGFYASLDLSQNQSQEAHSSQQSKMTKVISSQPWESLDETKQRQTDSEINIDIAGLPFSERVHGQVRRISPVVHDAEPEMVPVKETDYEEKAIHVNDVDMCMLVKGTCTFGESVGEDEIDLGLSQGSSQNTYRCKTSDNISRVPITANTTCSEKSNLLNSDSEVRCTALVPPGKAVDINDKTLQTYNSARTKELEKVPAIPYILSMLGITPEKLKKATGQTEKTQYQHTVVSNEIAGNNVKKVYQTNNTMKLKQISQRKQKGGKKEKNQHRILNRDKGEHSKRKVIQTKKKSTKKETHLPRLVMFSNSSAAVVVSMVSQESRPTGDAGELDDFILSSSVTPTALHKPIKRNQKQLYAVKQTVLTSILQMGSEISELQARRKQLIDKLTKEAESEGVKRAPQLSGTGDAVVCEE